MNRLLFLAALLALVGMCASGSVINLGTFAVLPQATFLYESANDSAVAALFINLAGLGLLPGETLQITAVGGECYGNTPCPPESPVSMGGVFDSNNVLLPSNPGGGVVNINRLTGTINSGASNNLVFHNQFLNTYYGNVDTTTPNDFYIPTGNGITVVIPGGAAYFVIGVLDSYYADDSDPSGTLGVQINQLSQNPPPPPPPTIPEPSTMGLLFMGMAGLAAFRQFRSRS